MVKLVVGKCWTTVLDEKLIPEVKSLLNFDPDEEEEKISYELFRETGKGFQFLSGLTGFVKDGLGLKEDELKYEWKPKKFGKIGKKYLKSITLRNYQVAAANRILEVNRGIIVIPTRGGKTDVACAVALKYKEKNSGVCIFIEPSIPLMHQTYNRLKKYGFDDVGRIGDGLKEIERKSVVVCVIDSLINGLESGKTSFLEMVKSCGFCFVDEVHLAGSPTYMKLWKSLENVDILIATSGTPFQDRNNPYTNSRDAYIVGVTGGIAFEISPRYLIENGWIAQGNVFVLDYQFKKPFYFIKSYKRVYEKFIVNNESRNELASLAARKLFERDFKVLVLVFRIEHGRKLLKLISRWYPEVVFSSGKGVEFINSRGDIQLKSRGYDAVREFNSGNLKVLIGSDVFKLGVDLPELDSVIMLRGEGRKHINTVQSVARCLVPNKYDNNVFIVDFNDSYHPYTKAHSQLRIHDYERVGHRVFKGYDSFLSLIDESAKIRGGN
jgi:superfamily II DNA or RNA helicase